MRQTSLRRLAVAAAALVVAGAVSAPAFAQRGHGFGPRAGAFQGGFGVFGIRGGGFGLGPGFGLGGPGFHEVGPGPRGGAAGVLGLDVLTPAASFLGISVTDLANDLKGGKSLADEAKAKGKTAADLISAVVAAEKKVLDNEVSAGWITSAQETALVSSLTDAITDLVNNGPPVPPSGLGTHQSLLDLASSFLGISVADLQTALKSGKTLADEAASKGKSVADLVAALEAPAKTDLDARVKDGTITQAQETAILNRLTTNLTDLVNGKAPTHDTAALRQALAKFALRMHLHR